MRILISVTLSIVILIGINTVQDSFSTPIGVESIPIVDFPGTWYLGEGLKRGDFFSYKVCHADYKECKEIQIDFWIEGDVQRGSETLWRAQSKVYDQDKVIYGHMDLGKIIPEPVAYSENFREYSQIFKSSLVWLGAFTLPNTPLSFQSPSWGNTGNIGGWDIIPSEIQTISVPAGPFETVLISWGNSGTLSKIWILDNFPFPIKADTFVRSVEERHPEYQFELSSYQQNVAVNPFSEFDTKQNKQILKSPKVQIKNGVEPQNILCKEDLELIFKSIDNSPACVKIESIPKLIERGWAKIGSEKNAQTKEPSQKSDFTVSTWVTGFWHKPPTIFTITPEKIIISNENTGHDQPPQEIPIAKQEWQELENLINFPNFLLLPDSIGDCPGCTDSNVQWIEITNSTISKKISFEPQENIREITDLRNKITEILETPR